MNEEIDKINSNITKSAIIVKIELDKLKKINSEQYGKTMHNVLSKKFFDSMKKFRIIQDEYKNKLKQQIERQVRISNPAISDDEITNIINTGDCNKIFCTPQYDIAYIKERHSDIKKLEKNILELHDIFIDMQTMVDLQGELMDQIDFNVQNSTINVEKGTPTICRDGKPKRCFVLSTLQIEDAHDNKVYGKRKCLFLCYA